MKTLTYLAVAAVVCCSSTAWAVNAAPDGVAFEYGTSDSSNSDVNLYRVAMQWDWKARWFDAGGWHLGGYWDLGIGYWDNRTSAPLRTHGSLMDIGLTPVFRIEQNRQAGLSPYLEAGIGFHLLSATSVSTERNFGSSFQFGDHIGAGVRFGDRGQFDLGYRYQHMSNGGLKEPNQGINFHQVRLQYHY